MPFYFHPNSVHFLLLSLLDLPTINFQLVIPCSVLCLLITAATSLPPFCTILCSHFALTSLEHISRHLCKPTWPSSLPNFLLFTPFFCLFPIANSQLASCSFVSSWSFVSLCLVRFGRLLCVFLHFFSLLCRGSLSLGLRHAFYKIFDALFDPIRCSLRHLVQPLLYTRQHHTCILSSYPFLRRSDCLTPFASIFRSFAV